MPKYEYVCNDCGAYQEHFISAKEVNNISEGNWPVLDCECGGKLTKRFSDPYIFSKRDVLKPLNIGSKAEDWKKAKAAKVDEAIYNEGFESVQEMKEAEDMAREEEVKRNKTPGTLTTGVKAPVTSAEKEAVKARMAKKKKDAQAQRRKSGI